MIVFSAVLLVGCSAAKPTIPSQPTLPAQVHPGRQAPDQPPVQAVSLHLQSFRMMSETTGWALAKEGVVRTSDGGVTWIGANPYDLMHGVQPDVFFLDAQTAWALIPERGTSRTGRLYRTADGGQNWTETSVPFSAGNLFFARVNGQLQGWALHARQGDPKGIRMTRTCSFTRPRTVGQPGPSSPPSSTLVRPPLGPGRCTLARVGRRSCFARTDERAG